MDGDDAIYFEFFFVFNLIRSSNAETLFSLSFSVLVNDSVRKWREMEHRSKAISLS